MSSGPIIVVGGLTGIGAAVATQFGARSVVWSRRTGVDACDAAQVERALARAGTPYALVHCVGEFEECPLLATDDRLYARLLASNLTSAFVTARAVVPHMVRAGSGRVILFAAAGAEDARAKTRAPLYFALKAAILSLARSLAIEVAKSGVTVNVISPGVIRHATSHTESQDRIRKKIPLGREGQAEDIVGAVKLLLSDEGSYITGANLTIDGGLALI